MGNTNLPEFGAAHEKNSRDTRGGAAQLTDKEQKVLRSSPSPVFVLPNPLVAAEEAIIGTVDTGYSPSGAT